MEEVETPDATTIDALAAFLGIPTSEDGEGRVLRDRRRPVRRGDRPRRLRRQRDQARQRGQGAPRPPPGDGRGDQGARHGGRLRLAARCPRTRSWSSTTLVAGSPEPGRRREPGRLAPAERRTSARDYTPDLVAEIANAREGDPCPNCGSPSTCATASRSATSSSSAPKYTDAVGAEYLGEDGERHPIVMGSYGIGLGRNVACIVEDHHDEQGHQVAGRGRPVPGAPRRARREQGPRGHRRSPSASTTWRPPRARSARSSTTTATSRRASSSPTPTCWACPGSSPSARARSAAGGIEVKNRETGEKVVRPIEDVEAFLAGRAPTPA